MKDITQLEIWKSIAGYEGSYEVSNLGRVRSLPRAVKMRGTVYHFQGRLLSASPSEGYPCVALCKGAGRHVNVRVHVLVLTTFVGSRPAGANIEGRHLDGIRLNCSLKNLAWGTHRENVDDAISHGTVAKGEKLPHTILTVSKVIDLRRLRREKNISWTRLGRMFGITRITARSAALGKTWKHVPMDETAQLAPPAPSA